jgi:hypothetical protein
MERYLVKQRDNFTLRLYVSRVRPFKSLYTVWKEGRQVNYKASTYTGQQDTENVDIYPCLERDSNPQSQCSYGIRLYAACLLGGKNMEESYLLIYLIYLLTHPMLQDII